MRLPSGANHRRGRELTRWVVSELDDGSRRIRRPDRGRTSARVSASRAGAGVGRDSASLLVVGTRTPRGTSGRVVDLAGR